MATRDTDLKSLNALIRTLQRFSSFDNKMQVSTILTLLEIAKAEALDKTISTEDVGRSVGMLSGTSTRNIYYWGEGHKDVRGGYQYVNVALDVNDRRRRLLSLTPKGRTFVSQLLEGLSDG